MSAPSHTHQGFQSCIPATPKLRLQSLLLSQPQQTLLSGGDVRRTFKNPHMIVLHNNFLGKEPINNLINNYIKRVGLNYFPGFLIIFPSSTHFPPWRRMLDPARRDPLWLAAETLGVFLTFWNLERGQRFFLGLA